MKTQFEYADEYCKWLNKNHKGSLAYNEAMLYSKYGWAIGIKNCSKIAKKYSNKS